MYSNTTVRSFYKLVVRVLVVLCWLFLFWYNSVWRNCHSCAEMPI